MQARGPQKTLAIPAVAAAERTIKQTTTACAALADTCQPARHRSQGDGGPFHFARTGSKRSRNAAVCKPLKCAGGGDE